MRTVVADQLGLPQAAGIIRHFLEALFPCGLGSPHFGAGHRAPPGAANSASAAARQRAFASSASRVFSAVLVEALIKGRLLVGASAGLRRFGQGGSVQSLRHCVL
jgi:hypothetical protein